MPVSSEMQMGNKQMEVCLIMFHAYIVVQKFVLQMRFFCQVGI